MQKDGIFSAVVAAVMFLGIFCGLPRAQGETEGRLLDSVLTRSGPDQAMPLQNALGQLGASLSVRNGYVLFGLEMRGDQEPVVRTRWSARARLGDALRQILDQVPNFEIKVISSRLVEVYPYGSWADRSDALNTETGEFNVEGVAAQRIIVNPVRFIPALHAVLSPKAPPDKIPLTIYGGGGFVTGPQISLHLRNVTVRQILDAVSEATEGDSPEHRPMGWWYQFRPGVPDAQQHQWGSLYSLPYDWGIQRGQ